jgi:hypothetical protein
VGWAGVFGGIRGFFIGHNGSAALEGDGEVLLDANADLDLQEPIFALSA